MDDPRIAALLREGDPEGLSQLYDRYASRLYAFCLTVVRDRGTAQDVVQDTLIIAYQRVGQLRDPQRLRPWLYALARNECLRQLRRQRRSTALEDAGDVPAEGSDPATQLHARDLQKLVWYAAEGLNPRERAALELSVRHGLGGRDLADALGVTVNHAQTLLTRARQQLERGLSALLIGRSGPRDCPELAGIVDGWDGRLTVLMRKRISRHVEGCVACAARKRDEVSATALLAATPLPLLPIELRARLLGSTAQPPSGEPSASEPPGSEPPAAESPRSERTPRRRAVPRRAGRFDREGFPYQGRRRRGAAAVGAAVVVALLLGVGVTVWWWSTPDLSRELADVAARPSVSSTPSVAATSAAASPSAAPSRSPATTPAGPQRPPTTAGPSPKPSPKPPAAGTLSFGENPLQVGVLAFKSTTIQAVAGAVTWSATPNPATGATLSVSPANGSLSAGQSTMITVTVNRQTNQSGSGTITFTIQNGGTQTLTVTWDKPIP
ncbi:MAG: sigma-70 family RNA polymerase sigma factor [Micromonosporaceae bacterium]